MPPFRRTNDASADSPMDPPASFTDDDGSWSVADVTEIHGSTPSTYLEDLLIDEEGNPTTVDPTRSRVRAAAVRSRTAAIATTKGARLREAGEHHADGTWFRWAYEARQPEAKSAMEDAELVRERLQSARATPLATRPKHAKKLSLLVKPAFLVGDIAVIFNILYKSGSHPLAAALTGVSAATGAVAAGTVAGHQAAVAYQRERRGKAPQDPPGHLVDLYQDEKRSNLPWTMWLVVAAMFSITLGVAVALITMAGGYPRYEAFGAGLITALTVLGSFAAEAYGTNACADLVDELMAQLNVAYATVNEIGLLRADSAKELTTAATIRAAGDQESVAAGELAMTVADPPKSNERSHGYVAAEPAADLVVPTTTKVEVAAPPTIDQWTLPDEAPDRDAEEAEIPATDPERSGDAGDHEGGGGLTSTSPAASETASSNGAGRRSPAGT